AYAPARGALSPEEDNPSEQERGEDRDVDRGLGHVLLDSQEEVENSQRAGEICEAVQTLPARESEAPDGRGGRGRGQRNEDEERGKAREDERPLRDIGEDPGQLAALVEQGVRRRVQQRV